MNFDKKIGSFMPNFPIKCQKVKTKKKAKPAKESGVRLTKNMCEKLSLFNSYSNSNSRNLSYRNQNNCCEIRSLIMTPIKLTKLEISLPQFSTLPSPKCYPRKITTATTRRRSIESKSFLTTLVQIPAEIITTKYTSRFNSARPRPFGYRKSEEQIRQTSRYPLARNRTGDDRDSSQKWITNDRIRETESISPTNYSPVYTNNIDI